MGFCVLDRIVPASACYLLNRPADALNAILFRGFTVLRKGDVYYICNYMNSKTNLIMKFYKINGNAIGRRKSMLLVIFLLSSVFCFAQTEKKPAPKAPAAPSAPATATPEAIKSLDKLIGEWEGTIPSVTGPVVTTRNVKTTYNFSRIFKNQALKMECKFQGVEDQRVTESYSVIAYDTSLKELRMMMVSDQGTVYDLKGSWTNKLNLNFNCNTERNGKKIGITIWFGLRNEDSIDYRMYTTIGNDLLITEEGKLTKKKQQAKAK
jgi:hypothetical protein